MPRVNNLWAFFRWLGSRAGGSMAPPVRVLQTERGFSAVIMTALTP
jgi:hypothetical protein